MKWILPAAVLAAALAGPAVAQAQKAGRSAVQLAPTKSVSGIKKASSVIGAPRDLQVAVSGSTATLSWMSPDPPATGITAEVEPNGAEDEIQHLYAPSPVTVNGAAQVADLGQLSVTFADDSVDDFEDLFDFTLTQSGGEITLTGLAHDSDLYLLSDASGQLAIVGESFNIGPADERIGLTTAPPGHYLVAVSIFDPGQDGFETDYTLTITAEVEAEKAAGYKVYRSSMANPVTTGSVVGEVDGETLQYADTPPSSGTWFYAVTALGEAGESPASNEVSTSVVTAVESDLPETAGVLRNWPNPFQRQTQVLVTLEQGAETLIEVVDVLGRQHAVLQEGWLDPGEHQMHWEADGLSPGVYLLRVQLGTKSLLRMVHKGR